MSRVSIEAIPVRLSNGSMGYVSLSQLFQQLISNGSPRGSVASLQRSRLSAVSARSSLSYSPRTSLDNQSSHRSSFMSTLSAQSTVATVPDDIEYVSTTATTDTTELLACPYYAENSRKHRDCCKGYKSITEVKNHIRRKHTYRCAYCHKPFEKSAQALHPRLEDHCARCCRAFKDAASLDSHNREQPECPLRCRLCFMIFAHEEDWAQHTTVGCRAEPHIYYNDLNPRLLEHSNILKDKNIGKSDVEKWQTLFLAIFPHHPPDQLPPHLFSEPLNLNPRQVERLKRTYPPELEFYRGTIFTWLLGSEELQQAVQVDHDEKSQRLVDNYILTDPIDHGQPSHADAITAEEYAPSGPVSSTAPSSARPANIATAQISGYDNEVGDISMTDPASTFANPCIGTCQPKDTSHHVWSSDSRKTSSETGLHLQASRNELAQPPFDAQPQLLSQQANVWRETDEELASLINS